MIKSKHIYSLICLFIFLQQNYIQGQNGKSELPLPGKQVSISENIIGDVIDNYWIYLPGGYSKSKKWPIILFLQGGNGISPDSTTSKNDGPAKYALIENENREFDSYVKDTFIIINPHMRPGSYWERQWYQQYSAINSILDNVINNYSGDSIRIYLTGLSRGGNGTWGLGQTLNNRLAAIIPVCGRIHGVTDFSYFKDTPIWITHCIGDETHNYQESLDAVNKIEKITNSNFLRLKTASPNNETYLNTKHIFTVFERNSHDAWSETYNKVEIYKWMLKQKNE